MKALIQRVINASVSVNGELISSIGQGACILIGINQNDTLKDAEFMAKKLLNIKLYEDNNKKWKKSVVDMDYEILCVSQFTLYATWKGNHPDFHNAMPGVQSKELYEQFLELLKKQYKPDKIKDDDDENMEQTAPTATLIINQKERKVTQANGVFGAYMQVSLQNDGPVTLELESPVQQKKNENRTS